MKLKMLLILTSVMVVSACSTLQYDNGVTSNPSQARAQCQNSRAMSGVTQSNAAQYMSKCMRAKAARNQSQDSRPR